MSANYYSKNELLFFCDNHRICHSIQIINNFSSFYGDFAIQFFIAFDFITDIIQIAKFAIT